MDDKEATKIQRDRGFISWACGGNADVMDLMDMLGFISGVWDDFVDKDPKATEDAINKAFWMALVGVPSNPFYRSHDTTLRPVIACGINAWMDATMLERKSEKNRNDLAYAFGLRRVCDYVLVECARILGGYEWMRQVSSSLPQHFLEHEDSFEEYLMEHGGAL